jgi:hypothetical protein
MKHEVVAVAIEPAAPGEVVRVAIESPEPGEECGVCERPYPKVKSDAQQGARREIIQLHVPKGEEGVLENLLISLVDKHKEAWPRDFAAMRAGVGLEVVGGRSWKYYAVHFSVYAALTVPGLAPVEEG